MSINFIKSLVRVEGRNWIEIHVNTELRKKEVVEVVMLFTNQLEKTLFQWKENKIRVVLNYEMDNEFQVLFN